MNIYKDFEQMRASGMSRKEFIELCQIKIQKRETMRSLFILEGALETLRCVSQVGTFAELPEFKEFMFTTERMLRDEQRVKKKCFDER